MWDKTALDDDHCANHHVMTSQCFETKVYMLLRLQKTITYYNVLIDIL